MKPAISLGDLADAVRILQPEDQETYKAMLAVIDPMYVEVPEVRDRGRGPIRIPPPPGKTRPRGPIATQRNAEAESEFYPSTIESHAEEGAAFFRIAAPSQPLVLSASERDEPRPELQPLLRPQSKRAILSAALSTDIPAGIDIRRTIALLVRREPLDRLPMRTRRSARRGVQLLLDKGSGMTPFLADQAAMTGWIQAVAGAQRVQVESFIGSPRQGVLDGFNERRKHSFPSPGTPIVLLSDLGIGRPPALDDAAPVDEWLAFAQAARQAQCPVLAFVPYAPGRWPRRLRRVMTMLQWDRALTAGHATKVTAR